jgi:outer membrane receptor protein involved in Fe transport
MNFPPLRKRLLVSLLPLSLTAFPVYAANDIAPATNSNLTSTDTALEKKPATNQATTPLDAFELPEIEVVGTTPVGTTGLKRKKISANVQTVEDEEINRHAAQSLPDFMNRRMQSVNINDVQNNPYQPDISYRGFSASSVLGTPIGLSVYQDGVRVNEAFGDTVNWDLIPQIAISSLEMMPGSNPLYGLNTLGGALAVHTKSGNSHPGFNAQAVGGSYGRQGYQAEYGGSAGNFDWYVAGNVFQDAGWRPFSTTAVNQGFSKIGWENDKTDLDLSFTYAHNNMNGVGSVPQELLQQNWGAIYTSPDVNQNTLYFVTLKGSHKLTDALQVSGNVYDRYNNNYTLNSNTSTCDTTLNVSLTSCTNANTPYNTLTPGYFQASRAKQNGTGINLQITSDYKIDQHENQFVAGGGFNTNKTHFLSAAQSAIFNPNYYELATEPLGDSAYGNTVNITGENTYSSLFATDTFSVFDWMHINSAINWTQAQVRTIDSINSPTDSANYLGNNVHFQRVNPAAGVTFNPLDALKLDNWMQDFTTYFNYNEGFRAPTTVEMACANPAAPCSLPNGFISDPALKPVVSHTMETGLRGKFGPALKWNFAVYQTINTNDILYLNAQNSINTGYFSNVGTTRRQGLELGLSGSAFEKLNWYISYGFVDATYRSSATLSNALGAETITAGDHIPSIPQNTFKVGSEYEFFHNFFAGADLQYTSSQFARGDDENIYAQIPAYTLLNLNSRYVLTKNIELFAMGRNVLNNHYVSFGQMSTNMFNGGNTSQFQGPGAPATGYAGVRLHWD